MAEREKYTPTTEEVRGDYATFQLPWVGEDFRDVYSEGLAEFDRWLAEHDAEKRAEWRAEQVAAEWEYGWAGDAGATVFYDTREEAEEFMGAPKKFIRRKAGEWVEV